MAIEELIEGFKQVGRKHKPKDIKTSWVQFKDKIYDVKTGESFEATPEYFVTNPIPWNVGKESNTPLMDKCVERDIIILGFLKRTGSTYLAEYLNIKDTYDRYIMNSLLIEDGQFISPIPVIDTNATRNRIHHKYVTFYINLKNWKYRFELLNQQEAHYRECVCNLLYIATDTHYGMNPIFSKADEYARVTKREANLKFNYVIHGLPYDERTKLRLEARKRTHFGLETNKSLMNGIRRSR